jgi:hypothetical protein
MTVLPGQIFRSSEDPRVITSSNATVFAFLLYSLLILNVTLRVLTNELKLLPKHLNAADVFIVLLFFLFFIIHRVSAARPLEFAWVIKYLILFDLVLIIGAALNSSHSYMTAALSQAIMLNEPIILFVVLVNVPFSTQDIQRFRRLLIVLVVLEIFLGVLQLPTYMATGNSESIIGTFAGNAEQYGAFLLISIFYLVGKTKVSGRHLFAATVKILPILTLMLLIDNKASWLGGILSFYSVLTHQSTGRSYFREKLRYASLLLAVLFFGWFIVANSSRSLHKFTGVSEAWHSGNFTSLGKVQAYADVVAAYRESPHMLLVGSGPGTFYSRAASQFYDLTGRSYYNPALAGDRSSNSMAGVIKPIAREPFYIRFYYNKSIVAVGSAQIDVPFASYVGLLGETGLVGTALYLAIYFRIYRKLKSCARALGKDEKLYPLALSSLGFFIYAVVVAIYSNFLEMGRMTTILWSMVAIVINHARQTWSENTEMVEAEQDAYLPKWGPPLSSTKYYRAGQKDL